MSGVLCVFTKHTTAPKQTNNQPNRQAALWKPQYRQTAELTDQHPRVFQARGLSLVEQERDQVAPPGTATQGLRSVRAAVFMVVLSAHIKLHKPF